jgi:peptide/nickel transport system permease protein
MCALALLAPVVTKIEPDFVNPVDRLQAPSSTYWFGTDDLGHDVYSQVIYGARISLFAAPSSGWLPAISSVSTP